jgi:hypothetical protein
MRRSRHLYDTGPKEKRRQSVENRMAQGNWIRRSSKCAQAWREPRWRPLLLGAPQTWVHATLPGILPAAIAVTTVMSHAVTAASLHLPPGHGA